MQYFPLITFLLYIVVDLLDLLMLTGIITKIKQLLTLCGEVFCCLLESVFMYSFSFTQL